MSRKLSRFVIIKKVGWSCTKHLGLEHRFSECFHQVFLSNHSRSKGLPDL